MVVSLEVVLGDITKLKVDAIVNAANSTLLGGGGVDGAIHRAAGPKLLEECKTVGGCPPGEARITKGYNLPAKWVIHTVGPIYRGGNNHEADILASCYRSSLEYARQYGIKSIAFPSISTGAYRYPLREAAEIAVRTVKDWVSENDSIDRVIFVCFSQKAYNIYTELLRDYA